MSDPPKLWYVYMVRCSDGSVYTGISTDVKQRIEKHNLGKGARFTAQRRPVQLLYVERHPDQSGARRREAQIKRWKKGRKEALAMGGSSF